MLMLILMLGSLMVPHPWGADAEARHRMGDLKDPRLIYLKGFLFLVAGTLAAGAILLESPRLRTLFLLGIALWSFCRLYYFMFYVIERYVDPSYRFAGIGSFLAYLLRKRGAGEGLAPGPKDAAGAPAADRESHPR
jgi:hypothetical protein